MKKILIYGLTKNLGGIENFIFNHVKYIDKSKFEVHFLVYEEPVFYEQLLAEGYIFHFVPRRGDDFLGNRRETEKIFKEGKFDIFWFNVCTLTYVYPLICAKKYGVVSRALHVHCPKASGGWKMELLHGLNKNKTNKLPNSFFACSQDAAKFSFVDRVLKDNDYQLILNAIDVDKYKFNKEYKEDLIEELKIKETKILGHVGHFLDVKNHHFLIDIFKDLIDKDEDYHLVLVGTGPLMEEIKNKVKSYALENKVSFLGRRSDVNKIMSLIDLFVFPSKYEGLSLSLVEAQSSGLRCIISDSISQENNLSGDVFFVGLDAGSEAWVSAIRENIDYIRKDNISLIREKGFDVKSNIKLIEEIMEGKLE